MKVKFNELPYFKDGAEWNVLRICRNLPYAVFGIPGWMSVMRSAKALYYKYYYGWANPTHTNNSNRLGHFLSKCALVHIV